LNVITIIHFIDDFFDRTRTSAYFDKLVETGVWTFRLFLVLMSYWGSAPSLLVFLFKLAIEVQIFNVSIRLILRGEFVRIMFLEYFELIKIEFLMDWFSILYLALF